MKLHRRVCLLLAGTIAVAGCKHSNSVTGPPVPGNIAGAWTGTFYSADVVDCDPNTHAQANFTLDGANVVGTLNAPGGCGFANVVFQGTIRGNTISGTIAGDSFTAGSTASGGISGDGATLELALKNSFGLFSGGQMELHR